MTVIATFQYSSTLMKILVMFGILQYRSAEVIDGYQLWVDRARQRQLLSNAVVIDWGFTRDDRVFAAVSYLGQGPQRPLTGIAAADPRMVQQHHLAQDILATQADILVLELFLEDRRGSLKEPSNPFKLLVEVEDICDNEECQKLAALSDIKEESVGDIKEESVGDIKEESVGDIDLRILSWNNDCDREWFPHTSNCLRRHRFLPSAPDLLGLI